jgi:hypothetical protein
VAVIAFAWMASTKRSNIGALARKIRIWSVFDKEGRLALAISDEPGEFNFARMPPDDVDPVDCAFATIQCYSSKAEPEMLNLLMRSDDLEAFLDALTSAGYKVRQGRPRSKRFARL